MNPAVLSLFDQGIVSGTSFLNGFIIGRGCSKSDFGFYLLGMSICIFFLNLQNSIIATPYIVYAPQLTGRPHTTYTGTMAVIHMVIDGLTSIVLFAAFFIFHLRDGASDFSSMIRILALVIGFILFKDFGRQIYFGQLKHRHALVMDTIVAIIQVSGLVVFASYELISVTIAFSVIGMACFFSLPFWIATMHRSIHVDMNQVIPHLKMNWAFGKWPLLAGLLITMGSQIYPWLLTMFYGTASTGELAAVTMATNLANPFIMGFGNFLAPKIMHVYATEGFLSVDKLIPKITALIIKWVGCYCIAMALFGGFLVEWMYGAPFRHLGGVIGVMALAQLADVISYPHRLGLFAINRSDIAFKASGISLLCTMSAGVFFVCQYNVLGVGLGLLAGNSIASLYRCCVYVHQARLQKKRL